MRAAQTLLLAVSLAACTPQPRSTAYFKAHHEEASRIFAACKTGAHRGEECQNAEAGVVDAKNQAEMNAFRKGF
ncbi:EexN family lipoprotein [Phenylobacterium sp.]|jgi:hypothetical protein|uniref:EexN family lipoprotein n=1 Tax=Phenylobacterium sp. TaxID=1871053 RepID=UPI0035AF6543